MRDVRRGFIFSHLHVGCQTGKAEASCYLSWVKDAVERKGWKEESVGYTLPQLQRRLLAVETATCDAAGCSSHAFSPHITPIG